MINGFKLGDDFSANIGIIMTKPPDFVIAEMDVKSVSVAGRSGDVLIDNGRYKNVSITYNCAIRPVEGQAFRDIAQRVATFLQPVAAYQRLQNTYEQGVFREARVAKSISVESIVEQAGRFTVDFDCKPQRWLLNGRDEITLTTSGGKVYNKTAFTAKPIITVYGTSAGVLTVGNIQCQIKTLTDYLTIDCENEMVKRDIENKNACVSIDEFPFLPSGMTGIQWTGGISKVVIEPRWWML